MKRVGLIAAVLLLAIIVPFTALASNHTTQQGQGLSISPPIVEANADPGQIIQLSVRLNNVIKQPLIARPKVDDFVAGGENGEPRILLDDSDVSPYSMKDWIQGIPAQRIEAGEVKTITFNVVVPRNASPGGHYAVVRFTGVPPGFEDDSSQVTLSASIGSLIFINVSGDAKVQADVASFIAVQRGKDKCGELGKRFFEAGALCFLTRVNNSGSVHIKPTGKLVVTNIWRKKVLEADINTAPARNVLPGSIRKFETKWDKRLLFGRYRATVNLDYADDKTMTKSFVFWVIPWKLLLLALVALGTLLWMLHRAVLRYNERIIGQAQNKNRDRQ